MTISNVFNHARAFAVGVVGFFAVYALCGIVANPGQSWETFTNDLARNYSVENPLAEAVSSLELPEAGVSTAYADGSVPASVPQVPETVVRFVESSGSCYRVVYRDGAPASYRQVLMANCVLDMDTLGN